MSLIGAAVGAVGGALIGGMMGGDVPDNSAAINNQTAATERVGMRQLDLAEKQYADQKALLDKYTPLFEQQIKLSTDAQAKQNSQSDQQWGDYMQYFRPVEQKLALDATNYDTAQRRESEAGAARADVALQFDEQGKALVRDINRSGLSLSSGKALALQAGNKMAEAKAAAGASGQARRQVEQAGLSLVDNAARFGRNMPSTGLQTATAAMTSGNNATGQAGGLSQMTAQPAAQSAGLLAGAGNSFANAGQLQLGLQNAQLNAWSAKNENMKDWIGAGSMLLGGKI